MKKTTKQIMTKIITAIILIFMFTNFIYVYASEVKTESKKKEATNVSPDKELSKRTDRDQTVDALNIEDIIFNKIPIFDIDFFKSKPAGVEVEEDKPAAIIRKGVAIWYISVRNLATVAFVLIIIYLGLKMLITLSAESKAECKTLIKSTVKYLIILWMINYIMLAVLLLNDIIVDWLYKNVTINDDSMYQTIKTRCYDHRASIFIPAVIMYLALIVIYIQFFIAYIRRTFKAMILTVIAPLVVVKSAIDSMSSKKSMYSQWLKTYVTNCMMQSVQCFVYVLFMSISVELATQNIMGFIMALIMMRFMLKADNIMLGLFKFDSSVVKENKQPLEHDKYTRMALGYYGITKLPIEKTIKKSGTKIKNVGSKLGNGALRTRDGIANIIDRNVSENTRKNILYKTAMTPLKINRAQIVDGFVNLSDNTVLRHVVPQSLKLKGQKLSTLYKLSYDKNNPLNDYAKEELSKGRKNLFNSCKGTVATSASIAVTGAKTLFAIPMLVGVENLNVGMGYLFVTSNIHNNYDKKAAKKDYNQTMENIININKTLTQIEDDMQNVDPKDKEKIKDDMKTINKLMLNKNQMMGELAYNSVNYAQHTSKVTSDINDKVFTKKDIINMYDNMLVSRQVKEEKDRDKIISQAMIKLNDNVTREANFEVKSDLENQEENNLNNNIHEESNGNLEETLHNINNRNNEHDQNNRQEQEENNRNVMDKEDRLYSMEEMSQALSDTLISMYTDDKSRAFGEQIAQMNDMNNVVGNDGKFVQHINTNKFIKEL